MKELLCTVLLVVALIFACENHDALFALVLCGIVSVYLFSVIADCLVILTLNEICVETIGRFNTSYGIRLHAKLAELFQRIRSLSWHSEQMRLLSRGVKNDPLFKEAIADQQWRTGDFSKLTAQVAAYAKSCIRADAVAIYLLDSKGGNALASLGIDGTRFTTLFERVVDRVSKQRRQNPDESVFESFGFPSSLLIPCCDKNGFRGVLWFGYAPKHSPSASDEQIARELAAALHDELRYAAQLQEVTQLPTNKEKYNSDELAKFSHDIRSPLNNVKAILALLKLEELRAESSELLEVALANCRGVESVVEDVIDFSKYRAGKLSRRQEIIELRELLEEVIESYRVAARMKGLQIKIEFPLRVSRTRVDKNQIRRVFSNLLSNALKYTRYGSVTIAVREITDYVEVSIQDTGVGISALQLDELFTPFTRFHADSSEGVGLGLSIVKILLEGNQGKIEVRSEVGVGSEFVVRLPRVESEAAATQESEISIPLKPTAAKRILVVDDSVDAVRSLARLLERDGFFVMQATTVRDTLSIVNFEKPDVIITDAEMPDGGGRRILNSTQGNGERIPVIIISGNVSKAQQLTALGAAFVLEKPYDYPELKHLIGEIMRAPAEAARA